MKDFSAADALEILEACLNMLAVRENEIRALYDKLHKYEPVPGSDKASLGAISPGLEEIRRSASPEWPGAVAVCGTPLVGRSLMLLCPQMGLRIQGITNSGLEGLSLVERHSPEFAFVDLDIDDIDGLVLISRMKDIIPDLTILALAAGNIETTLVSAMIAGARDVIAKPLQSGRILDTIKRLRKERDSKGIPSRRLPENINPAKSIVKEGWTVL